MFIAIGDGFVILCHLGFAPPILIHCGTELYITIVAVLLQRKTYVDVMLEAERCHLIALSRALIYLKHQPRISSSRGNLLPYRGNPAHSQVIDGDYYVSNRSNTDDPLLTVLEFRIPVCTL